MALNEAEWAAALRLAQMGIMLPDDPGQAAEMIAQAEQAGAQPAQEAPFVPAPPQQQVPGTPGINPFEPSPTAMPSPSLPAEGMGIPQELPGYEPTPQEQEAAAAFQRESELDAFMKALGTTLPPKSGAVPAPRAPAPGNLGFRPQDSIREAILPFITGQDVPAPQQLPSLQQLAFGR
ncbi:MAG: hypothetical protein OXL41_03850 [Nitrospinae bacterium]|nr:hypothetical protein [Nitrospinota bacterium]